MRNLLLILVLILSFPVFAEIGRGYGPGSNPYNSSQNQRNLDQWVKQRDAEMARQREEAAKKRAEDEAREKEEKRIISEQERRKNIREHVERDHKRELERIRFEKTSEGQAELRNLAIKKIVGSIEKIHYNKVKSAWATLRKSFVNAFEVGPEWFEDFGYPACLTYQTRDLKKSSIKKKAEKNLICTFREGFEECIPKNAKIALCRPPKCELDKSQSLSVIFDEDFDLLLEKGFPSNFVSQLIEDLYGSEKLGSIIREFQPEQDLEEENSSSEEEKESISSEEISSEESLSRKTKNLKNKITSDDEFDFRF